MFAVCFKPCIVVFSAKLWNITRGGSYVFFSSSGSTILSIELFGLFWLAIDPYSGEKPKLVFSSVLAMIPSADLKTGSNIQSSVTVSTSYICHYFPFCLWHMMMEKSICVKQHICLITHFIIYLETAHPTVIFSLTPAQ